MFLFEASVFRSTEEVKNLYPDIAASQLCTLSNASFNHSST